VVPAFVGWDDPGAAFTAVTQLGTVAAVLIYFRKDLVRISRTWLRSLHDPSLRGELDARMGWYILIGTIPIGIFGLAFRDQIEDGARDLYVIGIALIVVGLIMLAGERYGHKDREERVVNARDAVVIGLAQAVALIPGVSRSGSTITAGLFLGLERPSAAHFSFLLSIPAIVLSGGLQLVSILDGAEGDEPAIGVVALATLLAFLSGYASIAFLLRWLTRHTMDVFVAYRLVLGAAVLALAGAGVIS
jgi:undecaprenyl-diphosphatase